MADVINFHASSQNIQALISLPQTSRVRGSSDERLFLGLFFFNSLPLTKNSSWSCKSSLWEVCLEAAGTGGKQEWLSHSSKTLRALMSSTRTFWRHCEDNRALPRVITTARENWMNTQEEMTKGATQFFFWLFCFINLQTSHHLFHFGNQISTWFSLPVTKQKMLCVCPQSPSHGLQLCHLFWLLRLKKEELEHRRNAFDDVQASEGSTPH